MSKKSASQTWKNEISKAAKKKKFCFKKGCELHVQELGKAVKLCMGNKVRSAKRSQLLPQLFILCFLV